jgi:hypothetical protein
MDGDGDRTTRNPDDSTRLIFPLVAEPGPGRRWLGKAIAGGVIGAVLVGAVVATFSRLDQNSAPGGAAVVASGVDETARSQSNGREGWLSVFDLEAGMCLREVADGTDLRYVPVIPCEEAHGAEVAATQRMPDGPWPGPAAVEAFAVDRCVPAIHRVRVDASLDLRWTYFGPTESSWNMRHDRTISCVIVSDDRPLTGSVAGQPTFQPSTEQQVRVVRGEQR